MQKLKIFFSFILLCVLLTGCSEKKQSGKDADFNSVNIIRLDSMISEFKNMPEQNQNSVMTLYASPISDYLYMMGLTSDDLEGSIDSLANTAAFKIFYPDVNARYNKEAEQQAEKSLGRVAVSLSSRYKSVPKYKYYGIVSPFNQTIMTVDSCMFISLNHYLGTDYPGYDGMEDYKRKVKNFNNIKYDVAEAALSLAYPYKSEKDATLLNRLLYEGALINAVLDATGGDLAEMSGWAEDEYNLLKANESTAWRTLISNDLLYSTDASLPERLFSPAPSTPVLSPEAPGRAGRYVAYKLIQSYLRNNPNATPNDLLQPEFYNNPQSLSKAKYDPQLQ